jgi:hypothetical protein
MKMMKMAGSNPGHFCCGGLSNCHCEERSDEAIQLSWQLWIASLRSQ